MFTGKHITVEHSRVIMPTNVSRYVAYCVCYMHVQTQPHFNSFKPTNVDAICATLPRVATDRCPDMDDMAQAVANKYGRALMLYSKCHGQFNSSNTFSDEALASLRKFMYTQK